MVTLSLSLFSLLPFLFFLSHSHFSFSLPFVSIATTLKATVSVGHGSLLTGFHQLSLKKLKLLSLKTQTSLVKSGLSLPISLDGGDIVLVAWSWQWWHEGCGLWGYGLCVLWHGFLLGCRVVRWLWRGGGVVTGHGSIWVVGCGLGIDVDSVYYGWEQWPLSLLSLSDSLSSLFLSLRFCLSDWVLVLV